LDAARSALCPVRYERGHTQCLDRRIKALIKKLSRQDVTVKNNNILYIVEYIENTDLALCGTRQPCGNRLRSGWRQPSRTPGASMSALQAPLPVLGHVFLNAVICNVAVSDSDGQEQTTGYVTILVDPVPAFV
jgi:hypothetical protein